MQKTSQIGKDYQIFQTKSLVNVVVSCELGQGMKILETLEKYGLRIFLHYKGNEGHSW